MHTTTQQDSPRPTPQTVAPSGGRVRVYRHRKRPSWGLAAFLWENEEDGKRAYQFEDGRVRVFADGYYGLMEPIFDPADPAAARAVRRMAARSQAGQKSSRRKPMPRVADQVGLFMSQYPEGFAGTVWSRDIRGQGARRGLKRHRDRAVALAAKLLSRDALAKLLVARDWAAIRDRAVKVLRSTDLVTVKDVKKLASLTPTERLACTINDLLYGVKDHAHNLDQFVRELDRLGLRASWRFATALPALRFPDEHVCVRSSVFKEQARMIKPTLKMSTRPSGNVYAELLKVVMVVHKELGAAGRAPRDLLDVAQFIWATLRRSSRERLIGAGDKVSTVH